jgi:hypothetical protein
VPIVARALSWIDAASEFDEAPTSAASEGVNATATMAMAILTSCCIFSV